jgi:type VI protein secretion system component Hcp
MLAASIRRWALGAVAGMLLAWCPRVQAAAYIKFDGVDGESAHRDHKDWIVVDSVSLTPITSGPGAGCSAAPSLSEVVVTKALDSATAELQQAACSGTVFPTVRIHIHGSKPGDAYIAHELQDVLITSYSLGGSSASGEALPMESLSLNYAASSIVVETEPHR